MTAAKVVVWSSGSDGTGRTFQETEKLFKKRKRNVQFCGGWSQNPKYWKLFSSRYDFQDILVPPVNETGRTEEPKSASQASALLA